MARRHKAINHENRSTPMDEEVPLLNDGFSNNVVGLKRPCKETPRVNDDFSNILVLLFLYVLQGIPLGLAGSIPMILQQHHVSYKDQATFSLSFWPFSLKLLWAPVVDSCYWRWMGRRKSWLIPSQYLIGFFMLILSYTVNAMMNDRNGSPQILFLTCVFFALNFLAATQDIAVDGWALTMLSKKNVGWASTCNSVGQTAGYFLGYVVFLALESKDFCIKYLWQKDSLVTLPGFFFFWGIIFLVTTSLIWVFKKEGKEKSSLHEEEAELGLVDTYKVLAKMLKMTPIQKIIAVLLTSKIGFACADSLTVLKLTEAGVPKDRLALLSIPLTPVQIFLPLYISKFTAGPNPMDTYLAAYMPRLLFGAVFAGVVWVTPFFQGANNNFSFGYYSMIVAIYLVHQVTVNCMFVAQMSFHAQVSDPSMGGTYMTLLNTFSNLGGNWPAWISLRFVSELTWKQCSGLINNFACNSPDENLLCEKEGGNCVTSLDGYYVESVILIIIGCLWFLVGSKTIRKLQALPRRQWLIRSK